MLPRATLCSLLLCDAQPYHMAWLLRHRFAEGKSDKEILDHLLKNSRYDKRLLPPVDGKFKSISLLHIQCVCVPYVCAFLSLSLFLFISVIDSFAFHFAPSFSSFLYIKKNSWLHFECRRQNPKGFWHLREFHVMCVWGKWDAIIKNRHQHSVINTHTPIYKIFSVDNLIIPELKATSKLYVDTILILFTFIWGKRCIEC